jgi:2-keto-4-pentenoate hydratase/2-oxohepta-3-ene-1,7-dioic acid hydratase in catechol pathway
VKLLVPTVPTKVLAVGLNYRSHLGGRPMPDAPAIFLKPPSCLVPTGADIVLPADTTDVHYEGEMVVVIGKRARNVTAGDALGYVLGVTCGNDVSARQWQKNDLQWWRAKGSDTFGPCGPYIATDLDYDNLALALRVGGTVKQAQRTSDLIHGVGAIVSYISRYMTLEPGDLIYTGTPGQTTALAPGDVVEVELEGVGILRNRVVAPAL